jgi:putative transposase
MSLPTHFYKRVSNARQENFFLPNYCSEMNPIEPEWHQLKTHELAGRMFEDEYDLALAVMDGVEARGHRGGYFTERFKFNSA